MLRVIDRPDPIRDALAPFFSYRHGRVVLAVSGGGDSVAMLHAFSTGWHGHARPLAVTVDHGLREGAAEEARWVEAVSAGLRIEHRTLRLEPTTTSQSALRALRLDALRSIAGPADVVLLAHTADDNAETVAMRRRRGSGPGLAGIAPATLLGRTWAYRPLLQRSRQELRLWLRARGAGWFDDPSNSDRRFERVRVREGLTPTRRRELLAIAAAVAGERRDTANAVADAIDVTRGDGAFTVAGWGSLPRDQRNALLSALAAIVGGRAYAPDRAALARAADALERGLAFTVGGCRLECEGDALACRPEPRRRPSDRPLLVPGFDWALYRVLDPSLPDPPVAIPADAGSDATCSD